MSTGGQIEKQTKVRVDVELAALVAHRDKTRALKAGHDAGTADREDTAAVMPLGRAL